MVITHTAANVLKVTNQWLKEFNLIPGTARVDLQIAQVLQTAARGTECPAGGAEIPEHIPAQINTLGFQVSICLPPDVKGGT